MLGFDFDGAVAAHFQDQFQDLGLIGSGGFSTVRKVKNKYDLKIYALKTVSIKPEHFKSDLPDYLEKVLGEVKIISSLKHPNVLQYHGCWVSADLKSNRQSDADDEEIDDDEDSGGMEMIVEEYSESSCGFEFERTSSSVEKKRKTNSKYNKFAEKSQQKSQSDNIFGTNLHKYKQIRVYMLSQLAQFSLQKHAHLRNKQKLCKTSQEIRKRNIENYRIILDVIEGLSYIHSQNVIHRDIKMQNIVIDEGLKGRIIDFGLAKKTRVKSQVCDQVKYASETEGSDWFDEKHSSSVGTRIFSSPEQSSSGNYDYRTDIYSLAMVIGMLFSEYTTIHQQSQLIQNLRNKNLQTFQIAGELKHLLCQCLSEQKQRPQLKKLKECIKNLLRQELTQTEKRVDLLEGNDCLLKLKENTDDRGKERGKDKESKAQEKGKGKGKQMGKQQGKRVAFRERGSSIAY